MNWDTVNRALWLGFDPDGLDIDTNPGRQTAPGEAGRAHAILSSRYREEAYTLTHNLITADATLIVYNQGCATFAAQLSLN